MAAEKRFDAMMEVRPAEVGPGQIVPYRIVNTGTVDLICGLAYRLERRADDTWVCMNPGMAFRAIGFGVSPGHYRELQARIPADAPPGLYRLIASAGSDHVSGRVEVSGQFSVTSAS
jgi:hypothetical protein